MATVTLEHLIGETLDQRFQIMELLRIEPERALFRSVELIDSIPAREALIVVDLSNDADEHFKRFLEARFLSHANLAAVSWVGWLELFGHSHPWIATELPSTFLADLTMRGDLLSPSELAAMAKQVAEGLGYLHAENLAYCALGPESVWQVGVQWVLSDFSELRVIGSQPGIETHGNLLPKNVGYLPPEALNGEVSPAWDVWSLGVLVRVLLDRPSGPASLDEAACAQALQALVEANTAPDPARRPTAAGVPDLLKPDSAPGAIPETEPEPAVSEDPPREPAPPRLRARAELLLESPARKKSRRSPWWFFVWALLTIGACLTALAVTRTLNRRDLSPHAQSPVFQSLPQSPQPSAIETPRALDPSGSPAKDAIAQALNEWRIATKTRNVAALVNCYAPVVDSYFGRRHMSRASLVEDKQTTLSRLGPIERFDVSDVSFERLTRYSATVSFKKTWIFGGSNPFFGAAREQMWLRRTGDEWKITSEREVKVY